MRPETPEEILRAALQVIREEHGLAIDRVDVQWLSPLGTRECLTEIRIDAVLVRDHSGDSKHG